MTVNFYPDKRYWVNLDQYRRYQNALSVENIFPNLKNGLCGCGCGNPLPKGKRRWYSKQCQEKAVNLFFIIKGDGKVIRQKVFDRDKGACRACGLISDTWQADHILPVHKGGGACGLDNFQTLCIDCHKEKTANDFK